jgi:hypothetical protein
LPARESSILKERARGDAAGTVGRITWQLRKRATAFCRARRSQGQYCEGLAATANNAHQGCRVSSFTIADVEDLFCQCVEELADGDLPGMDAKRTWANWALPHSVFSGWCTQCTNKPG